ncbi:MAG: hypothetical protein KIT47_07370 [Rhodoferax sp.]|nr:hypothetical protein [Rhodoferax sp.]
MNDEFKVPLRVATGIASLLLTMGVACARDADKQVEFVDLFRSLLVPLDNGTRPPPWSLGSQADVRWESALPTPSYPALAKEGLPYAKSAAARIVVDGKVSHERADGTPGQWRILLAGNKAGPLEARLSMDAIADSIFDPQEPLRRANYMV